MQEQLPFIEQLEMEMEMEMEAAINEIEAGEEDSKA
jgi:hypothetical protein